MDAAGGTPSWSCGSGSSRPLSIIFHIHPDACPMWRTTGEPLPGCRSWRPVAAGGSRLQRLLPQCVSWMRRRIRRRKSLLCCTSCSEISCRPRRATGGGLAVAAHHGLERASAARRTLDGFLQPPTVLPGGLTVGNRSLASTAPAAWWQPGPPTEFSGAESDRAVNEGTAHCQMSAGGTAPGVR